MTTTLLEPSTKLPPSTHPFAEVIHRLEAGGSMLPDKEKTKTKEENKKKGA